MDREIRQIKEIYEDNRFLEEQKENKEVRHLRKVLFKLSGNLENKRTLFLGCGDGEECIPYFKRGAKIYGVDISKTLIENANTKLSGNFLVMDFKNIKIQNSFDLIISILSIHYSGNLEDSLRKVYGLLRPGGTCLIATTHPAHKMTRYNNGNYFVRGKKWYSWQGIKRFNYLFLIEDYVNNFSKIGFSLERMSEVFTPPEYRSPENKGSEKPIFTVYKIKKP